ncbi:MAG: 50S ribosomal protein L22 [Alphaproteobacteria bacterium RIFCSPLOWO2_01_FULL_40_26]|nr:MAG: 50S ribosomal protein L22 [Alphaproteobacteria bacterium RIFCSPHIGHO2_02_FULL_40_34]OFW87846.1 MAG: 50S ribosomal protein L22 [Alphaproteobacteria bacterium RIFCSPHIGHO2_01_FULL_40_8]OFW95081.1 MAG: 50S ribosomal protein L22 [Alphaproteobacteria bacterium RIFCSPLOWO2_01_FULL_40_26]OFX09096.1 MAG: 50S ribosomal protein L22 [Alphaproteobacteria bacterium RIFCSPLOWO2_02_FULL_40_19]OFX12162.1 MAG: 50S ribosomal protein L22 [Alphaproteobacteria bacterium RIFCSPLOWO2_12_FULL_40_11]
MTEKTAIASLKTVKSSPIKVMRITKNITGRSVVEVLKLLQFSKLKLASPIRALVYSAMSNAENNHNMDVDNLYVKEVRVGRAFALRRFAARGRGKSSRILKTFSNISVILAEKELEKKQKIQTKKEAKNGSKG